MNYVVAGYVIVLVTLAAFAVSVVWRERSARAARLRAGDRDGQASSSSAVSAASAASVEGPAEGASR